MNTMIEDRGATYVAQWPLLIARDLGMSPEYVATAIRTILPEATITAGDVYGDAAHPDVASLTPAQAQAVVAELRSILTRISRQMRTHCRGCGLPLVHGRCQECV